MSQNRSRSTPTPTPQSVLIGLREPRVGGAERLVLDALPRLRRDFKVEVAVLSFPSADRATLGGVPVSDTRQLLAGRYCLVHTHLFLPGVVARLRRILDPSFRWVHSVHYLAGTDSASARLRQRVDRWVFSSTDLLIAVSPTVFESVSDLPQARLLPNAVCLDRVPSRDAESDRSGLARTGVSAARVGTVAMLRREKGLGDLILAIAILRDRGFPVTLRIAGDGPERTKLDDLIRSLDLGDHVELCGYVADIPSFYDSLDVYVQPSVSESFGLAVLDSLRYRVPTVATAVGYLPELLGQGQFGLLLTRDGNVVATLAAAIEQAFESRALLASKAEAGRAYWAERLDPDARANALADFYRAALRPRICYVAPILTHGGGGLQRQVELQSRALVASGHRTLLIQRRDERLRADPTHLNRWRHAEVLSTPNLPPAEWSAPVWERIRGVSFVLFSLFRLFQHRRNYDVIVAQQLYSPTFVGAIAKVILGKKLVVRVTASGSLGELHEVRRLPFARLRRWAFNKVDRVIVLTEAMREEMRTLGFRADRIVRIPNAVERPASNPPRSPDPSRPFRLLYTGRISTEKCLETVVDAARIVADSGDRIEVRLVGRFDGPRDSSESLRARTHDLPSRAVVLMPGPTDDVTDEYKRADAFVLPSESEGMSNSLLEAMAHAVPCLVSDIPENRAVIGDDGGLTFAQGNASSLAGLLIELIKDRDNGGCELRRLGAAAHARVATFAVDVVAERMSELLNSLVQEEAERLP